MTKQTLPEYYAAVCIHKPFDLRNLEKEQLKRWKYYLLIAPRISHTWPEYKFDWKAYAIFPF
jgi:hypothetical protein